MKTIETINLCKNFGNKQILKNINFSAEPGEIIVITGKSGKGKTTFFRCLAGLEKINSGSIKIHGNYLVKDGIYNKHSYKSLKKLGFIFQNFNLFPHLTVKQNINVPALNSRIYDIQTCNNITYKLIKEFKLEDIQNYFPQNLSGGQKQRVAIARSLALNPNIILFDEPSSALDSELIKELIQIIKDLANQNYTILIITHDTYFAKQISNKILTLENSKISLF